MADKEKPNRFTSNTMKIIKAQTPNFYRQRELWLAEFLKEFQTVVANPEKFLYHKMNLDGFSISDSQIERLILIDCSAENIKLNACEIEQLVLIRSNIHQADFSETSIQTAVMIDVASTNVSFANASLESAWLQGDFSGSDFNHSKLYQAVLKGNFQNVSFRNANCVNTWIRETTLHGANFTDAVIQGMRHDLVRPGVYSVTLPDGSLHVPITNDFYKFTRKPKTNNQ